MILNLRENITRTALDAHVALQSIRDELNLKTLDEAERIIARHGFGLPVSRQGKRRALSSIFIKVVGNRVFKN